MTKRLMSFLLLMMLLLALACACAEPCTACDGAGFQMLPVFGTGEIVQVKCLVCGGNEDGQTTTPEQAAGSQNLSDAGNTVETCQVCSGSGYQMMPAFGNGEMVQVKCSACGDNANEQPSATFVPVQTSTSVTLLDPGDFASVTDQCVYAEPRFAAFECEGPYDIDGYIAALTASTGLEVTGQYALHKEAANPYNDDDGRLCLCYQLTHPDFSQALHLDTCHVFICYYEDGHYSDTKRGHISFAVGEGSFVQLPVRADSIMQFFKYPDPDQWMPTEKSLTLPDALPYAKGNDEIRSWTTSSMVYRCPEGYDIDGYIDLLRYQYGFDVEAVVKDHGEGCIRYALNNPDIDAKSIKTDEATAFTRTKRQLEITYSFDGLLSLYTADYSSIQLPVRTGAYYMDNEEQIDLYGWVSSPYHDEYSKNGNQYIHANYSFYRFWKVVHALVRYEEFYASGIVENGSTVTCYLFMPGFHTRRLSDGISHISFAYNADTEELIIEKDTMSIELPESVPRPTPVPERTPAPNPDGGGFPVVPSTGGDCGICGGDGQRTCGSCFGRGTVGYGSDLRDCPNFNCRGGYEKCWTCGGDGKK